MENQTYIPIWNKYRPAILQLMAKANDEPQQYQFFSHEFKRLNPKEKGGYTFTLQAFQGKAQNDIRKSMVAQNLLNVLDASKTASELLAEDQYEFSLDKQFVLHVSRVDEPNEAVNEAEEA
jgi:hypothetical protein